MPDLLRRKVRTLAPKYVRRELVDPATHKIVLENRKFKESEAALWWLLIEQTALSSGPVSEEARAILDASPDDPGLRELRAAMTSEDPRLGALRALITRGPPLGPGRIMELAALVSPNRPRELIRQSEVEAERALVAMEFPDYYYERSDRGVAAWTSITILVTALLPAASVLYASERHPERFEAALRAWLQKRPPPLHKRNMLDLADAEPLVRELPVRLFKLLLETRWVGPGIERPDIRSFEVDGDKGCLTNLIERLDDPQSQALAKLGVITGSALVALEGGDATPFRPLPPDRVVDVEDFDYDVPVCVLDDLDGGLELTSRRHKFMGSSAYEQRTALERLYAQMMPVEDLARALHFRWQYATDEGLKPEIDSQSCVLVRLLGEDKALSLPMDAVAGALLAIEEVARLYVDVSAEVKEVCWDWPWVAYFGYYPTTQLIDVLTSVIGSLPNQPKPDAGLQVLARRVVGAVGRALATNMGRRGVWSFELARIAGSWMVLLEAAVEKCGPVELEVGTFPVRPRGGYHYLLEVAHQHGPKGIALLRYFGPAGDTAAMSHLRNGGEAQLRDCIQNYPRAVARLMISDPPVRQKVMQIFSDEPSLLPAFVAALPQALSDRPKVAAALELALRSDISILPNLLQIAESIDSRATYTFGSQLSHHYSAYERPKRSGGRRVIAVPSPSLKFAQRALLHTVFAKVPAHPCAHGFIQGRNSVTNAEPHVGRRVVVNVDIRNFFGSTRYNLIHRACYVALGPEASARAVGMLAELCSYRGALPTGAPTSPAIANIVLHSMDLAIASAAAKRGVTYTRYADDLTFSADTNDAVDIPPFVERLLRELGLELDERKTHVYRKGRRQEVTGLVVNDTVNATRGYRRRLRAAVHEYARSGQATWNGRPMTLAALAGHLGNLAQTQPAEAAALREKIAGRGDAN